MAAVCLWPAGGCQATHQVGGRLCRRCLLHIEGETRTGGCHSLSRFFFRWSIPVPPGAGSPFESELTEVRHVTLLVDVGGITTAHAAMMGFFRMVGGAGSCELWEESQH